MTRGHSQLRTLFDKFRGNPDMGLAVLILAGALPAVDPPRVFGFTYDDNTQGRDPILTESSAKAAYSMNDVSCALVTSRSGYMTGSGFPDFYTNVLGRQEVSDSPVIPAVDHEGRLYIALPDSDGVSSVVVDPYAMDHDGTFLQTGTSVMLDQERATILNHKSLPHNGNPTKSIAYIPESDMNASYLAQAGTIIIYPESTPVSTEDRDTTLSIDLLGAENNSTFHIMFNKHVMTLASEKIIDSDGSTREKSRTDVHLKCEGNVWAAPSPNGAS